MSQYSKIDAVTRHRMQEEMQDYFNQQHKKKKAIHESLLAADAQIIDRKANPELWYDHMMKPKRMSQDKEYEIRKELESDQFKTYI